ncbi:MAG TPA: CusA/CzcA family heavy metal efflux RND transporter [Micropepsaceae bacterium]|nr:CusA/CzcA family heavy metal efflux RND transporter [Micropepsaceae bacterium]
MISRILSLSVQARWFVVFLTAIVAAYGFYEVNRLPIDALPDITNKQVQINTLAPALGPEEVEKRVTFPIETALSGLAGVESTRSFSRNGYGQVTAIFREDMNLYFMRQQVAERLAQAKPNLPPGIEPQMGPVSTGLGEIFMYTVEYANPDGKGATVRDSQPGWQSDGSYLTAEGERLTDEVARLAYLRTVQDWILRPQLRVVPGVADIDSLGGYEKEYVVEPDPTKLASYGISYSEIARALEAANLSVGANYLQRAGEAYLVRADARIRSIDEVARAVILTRNGIPVMVKDVADVRIGGELRRGAASKNGYEVVIGTTLMLAGENSRIVASAVRNKLMEIRNNLPPGIVANVALDRSQLVNATITTVVENLAIGALLVIATLFLILGNVRAATIATLVIPLSILMSATGMNAMNISGNLMSLGALDFGLIIDGAVIIVENTLRRIAERQKRERRVLSKEERLSEAVHSSQEMVRPTVYGQIVIFLVFVPCLTFQGVEGKMFSPMVITLMLALASAFVLSLTFVPAMVALLVRGRVAEREVAFIRGAKRLYQPILGQTLIHPLPFIAAGIAVFSAALATFVFVGRVFMPTLDETNFNLSSVRIPSTSIEQSVKLDLPLERAMLTLPEVSLAFSKAGTASLAADPMPPNASDNYVMLKPKSEWPAGVKTKDDVLKRIEQVTAPVVGNWYEITQPIQMRFNELIGGVRSDVAVAIYGDDLDQMSASANRIASALAKVRGVADLRVAQTQGFPTFDVKFNRDAIGRYGLTMEDVADSVSAALGGRPAGLLFDGDRRYQIVVRVANAQRNDLEALGSLPIMLPAEKEGLRRSVPLRQLASFGFSEGLNEISRDNGKRRIFVEANVRGRDIGSFVDEAQANIARDVKLPPGSWTEWGGQYQNLQEAVQRLEIVIPVCMILIFATLYMSLGNMVLSLAVFTGVPLAVAGGVFAIALRGIPFSVSAAVGFIAVSGVAVLNGLVLMASIRRRLEMGEDVSSAIFNGALERVRPVLMTALVASLGFVPMAIATGTGAEVQRPLATVVIGGLITSTALTLFVLPAICGLILRQRGSLRSVAERVA